MNNNHYYIVNVQHILTRIQKMGLSVKVWMNVALLINTVDYSSEN